MENKHLNQPEYLFEVSWEVCNLVGGIYTVLSTKAQTLTQLYGGHLFFIGPDVWQEKESPYFAEDKELFVAWREKAKSENIKIRIGRWNVPGNPIAILVDFRSVYAQRDHYYGLMWEKFRVDSLPAYGDYDESCMFAIASAKVIESYYQFFHLEDKKVVTLFNEWTTGMGLLYTKLNLPKVGTVFTTHATCIGRSIAGNNKPLYDYLGNYNGDQMARELNMVSKHSLEKAAAHFADSFTTVSEITARECRQLLERTPLVTPNAFEKRIVPQEPLFVEKRIQAREKISRVVSALIGQTPKSDAIFVITSGRYEFRNKGIGVFIDAINQLKEVHKRGKEIIAFITVPAWVNEARQDLQDRLKASKSYKLPLEQPFITHWLHNQNEDMVVRQINQLGLLNGKKDLVKLIFVPSYLKGDDGIFNLPYYDLLIGMDISVFPSYYEPWGYTPLESVAFGVPTLTTDLAGFGLWVQSQYDKNNIQKSGVEVMHRTDYNRDELVANIVHEIDLISRMSVDEKHQINQVAMECANRASWKEFIKYYQQAFDNALSKVQ